MIHFDKFFNSRSWTNRNIRFLTSGWLTFLRWCQIDRFHQNFAILFLKQQRNCLIYSSMTSKSFIKKILSFFLINLKHLIQSFNVETHGFLFLLSTFINRIYQWFVMKIFRFFIFPTKYDNEFSWWNFIRISSNSTIIFSIAKKLMMKFHLELHRIGKYWRVHLHPRTTPMEPSGTKIFHFRRCSNWIRFSDCSSRNFRTSRNSTRKRIHSSIRTTGWSRLICRTKTQQ